MQANVTLFNNLNKITFMGKILLTDNELKEYRPIDLIPIECDLCYKTFYRMKKDATRPDRNTEKLYCTKKCSLDARKNRIIISCKNCGLEMEVRASRGSKYKNTFCSWKCSGIYTQANKTHGYRRSKLEKWLETKLTEIYDFEIIYNKRCAIGMELDIYIPQLKLAFEINGIFHYEPIFGEDVLAYSKLRDEKRFNNCVKNGIELVEIKDLERSKFSPNRSRGYLNVICSIINRKQVNF